MQYEDTSESIVTDDLPSLYSVPHKFRSESRGEDSLFPEVVRNANYLRWIDLSSVYIWGGIPAR